MTLRTQRGDDGDVRVSVADTGCGLPPGGEETVFEPYHSTKAEGLGLGLSLSRSIITAHGGRLWAENRPGGRAILRVALPAGKDEAR